MVSITRRSAAISAAPRSRKPRGSLALGRIALGERESLILTYACKSRAGCNRPPAGRQPWPSVAQAIEAGTRFRPALGVLATASGRAWGASAKTGERKSDFGGLDHFDRLQEALGAGGVVRPAAGADIVAGLAAAAVGAGIGLCFHEGAGPLHDLGDAGNQALRRDRLGQEFINAGVARRFDLGALGINRS